MTQGYSTAAWAVHTVRRLSSHCRPTCWTLNPRSGQSYCSFNSHTNSNFALMKYILGAGGWTHSTKLYPNIKICCHDILEQLAVLPLANKTFDLTISKYNKLSTVGFVSIYCQGERIRNNCKAWYQKLLSTNGNMFTLGLCKVGTQNDLRGNSRASAKQLSHNKSCCFQLEYIDMQPNHILSVANIVENRYTWTELPDVERAFHSRQISGTRSKSRRHESERWQWQ